MAKPKISDLKYYVSFLDWQDTPVGEAETKTERTVLFETYAAVKPMSEYSINAYRVNVSDREKPTHKIVIREPCDFEVNPQMFVFREHKGRRQRFKVLGVTMLDDCFMAITAALWRNDSDKLDPLTQDIPEYAEGPDVSYDMRDAGW